MVDDNAINPETGETIYVGVLEKLPQGFIWIHDLRSSDDWLKIVRRLTCAAPDAAKSRRQNVVCPECETLFAVELSQNAAQVS